MVGLTAGAGRSAAALALVTRTIAEQARTLGLAPLPAEERGPHMLGVRLPVSMRADIVSRLAADNCFAALRGEMLRIAPHLHVTGADIARLMRALATTTAP